jgi:hypothetical protein
MVYSQGPMITARDAVRRKTMPHRICGRSIFHALPIEDANPLPITLDADPSPDGSYKLVAWGGDLCLPFCELVDETSANDDERYVRHRCFETL